MEAKKACLLKQDDVDYVSVSSTSGQACGGCRWFNDAGYNGNAYSSCQLVNSYPIPIRETGWCEKYEAMPEPEPDYIEVIEELTEVLSSLDTKEQKPNLIERVKALFSFPAKARDEPFTGGFKAVGGGKWVGMWSNNFEDREGEYFPARATDAYIARLDAKEIEMPELYFWHIPYSYGKATTVMRVAVDDRPNAPSVSIAAGYFYDNPIAKAFEKATLKSKGLKMSHGFLYPPQARVNGVYHYYDTFEISALPPYAAANPYTLFGEDTMPVVTPEKQKELEALLGKDKAAEVVIHAEQRAKDLETKGIGHKDMSFVDTEARTQLEQLSKQMTELTEAMKAAKMPTADEDADKKKKADDESAFRKEVSDAIKQLATSQQQTAQALKAYIDLTPRRASKSADTLVPENDPALKELQGGMSGEKSNEDKVFHAAFGGLFGGATNGA